MSHPAKAIGAGILGAIAISSMFGAVQFASGRDLSEGLAGLEGFASPQWAGVNRAAKADRAAAFVAPAAPTRTISFKLDELADTSILVRIPLTFAAGSNAAPPSLLTKPGEHKSAIACEPVVSVLTEVAKRLQPGRCVT
jgi:hypothetical protein